MHEETGRIVQSVAGHDKGELFCVIGVRSPFLLLADGRRRKLAAPKRKKPAHVRFLELEGFDHPALRELRTGNSPSDRALRVALAAFKGGNHTWQKTI
jgi:hypothetical protein